MDLIPTAILGCFQLKLRRLQDQRGSFTKIFQNSVFAAHGVSFSPKESFLTQSKGGVLRGLHFQSLPYAQTKAILCISGAVFDVVLDLRADSPTYKKWVSFDLSDRDPTLIIIPRGCAHGFYVTGSSGDLLYLSDAEYQEGADSGILWNSAGILWPITEGPILSERDLKHRSLSALFR